MGTKGALLRCNLARRRSPLFKPGRCVPITDWDGPDTTPVLSRGSPQRWHLPAPAGIIVQSLESPSRTPMTHTCPRCSRLNPPVALFCFHDGAALGNGSAHGRDD